MFVYLGWRTFFNTHHFSLQRVSKNLFFGVTDQKLIAAWLLYYVYCTFICSASTFLVKIVYIMARQSWVHFDFAG